MMTGFLKKKTAAPLALYDGVAEGLKVNNTRYVISPIQAL